MNDVQRLVGQPLGIQFTLYLGSLPELSAAFRRDHNHAKGGHLNLVVTANLDSDQMLSLKETLKRASGRYGTRFGRLHIKRIQFISTPDGARWVYFSAHLDSVNPNRG
ncbi:MAG: hypothetical protein ACRD24_12790, partial [Terriglobales bacterium]